MMPASGSARPHPQVVARRVGSGAVLLHLGTNHVFELNETGSRIWELLEQGARRNAVVETLVAEFDVQAAAAAHAVDSLVGDLTAEGLLLP